MIKKIRINNKDSILAEVEFDTGDGIFEETYFVVSSTNNVENVFVDYEQSETQGFIEVMDIDLE